MKFLNFVCLVALTAITQFANARKYSFSNQQSSSAIVSSAAPMFDVEDDEYSSLPTTNGFINHRVVGTVMLYVDHTHPNFIGNAYKYTYEIQVKRYSNNKGVTTSTEYLTVEYNPNANPGVAYKDKVAITFNGAHRLELEVKEVKDANGNIVNDPENNLILKGTIDIERYWDLNVSNTTFPVVTATDLNADSKNDELNITWTPIQGAETYDLEWIYVDDYIYSGLSNVKLASQIAWDFKNNATRINTAGNSYKVNLVFERGYVIFRVRAVGKLTSNIYYDLFGDWSIANSGSDVATLCGGSPVVCPYYYVDENHQSKLNWQYSSVYAEEGKKKEVVGYYDGSLRGRQTVTKINTDNTAIAGESFYDFTGRKAIDVLPVPLNSPALNYNANLNVNLTGDKYTWQDFDQDGGSPCNAPAGEMGTQSGASKYYSPSNPLTTGKNAYIPDAKKYPFAQIEYTPDNTGRIRRQSGIGDHHQLNSGHESKYYYGQPNQIELDRLFGSEVGFARHYKKNMVIDPNGQISISYLDQEGRVIATALSGTVPGNVAALASRPNSPSNVTVDLFGKLATVQEGAAGVSLTNLPNIEYTAIEFSTYLLVSEPGDHVFNYGVTPLKFTDNCLPENFCFDCVYDLDLIVRDECGTIIYTKTSRIGSPTALDNTCNNTIYFSEPIDPFTLNLPVGSYHITKLLSVNKDAYLHYLKEFLNPENNSCIVPMATLLAEEKAKLDYDGCDITCDECAAALGTKDEYVLAGKGTEADWQAEYDECMAPCKDANICEGTFHMMLQDMNPGGQYGEFYNGDTKQIDVAIYPLSIYNYDNQLPDNGIASNTVGAAYWKNPVLEKLNGTILMQYNGFYDEDLTTRSKIYLHKTGNSFFPASSVVYDQNTNPYCYPEELTNLADFISAWKPSWSYSLVYYHPEYCYNKWCDANLNKKFDNYAKNSSEFDQELLGIETYAEALLKYPTLTNSNALVNADPYCSASVNATFKTALQNRVNVYESGKSMLQVAAIATKCPAYYGNGVGMPTTCGTFGTGTTEELDIMWQTYRSFYLSVKQQLLADAADNWVHDVSNCHRGINTCIGNEYFNPFNSKYAANMSLYNSANSGPCAYNTQVLYKSKVRRFDLTASRSKKVDANKARFNKTYYGKECATTIELGEFLSEIARKGNINTAHAVMSNRNLTPELYMKMLNVTSMPTTNGNWNWSPSKSGSVLTGLLTNTSGPSGFNITIKILDNINWSNIKQFKNFKYNAKYNSGMQDGFSATVVMLDGYECPMFGSTSMQLDDCAYGDECINTDYANAMVNLMSALSANGNLINGSPVNLENAPYATHVNRFIRNYISSPNNNLRWQKITANTFDLFQLGTSNKITVSFNSYLPTSFTNANLGSIVYFDNLQFVKTNLNTAYTVDAYYGTAPYSKVTISGTFSAGRVAYCYKMMPAYCENAYVQSTRDFEVFLKSIIETKPTINMDLLTNNLYTSTLEQFVGKGASTTLTPPFFDDNEVTSEIIVKDNTNKIINSCKLRLYRKNSLYFKAHGSLSNITELGYLHTTNGTESFGKENNFTVVVRLAGGFTEELQGTISCIPLSDCRECPQETNGTGEAGDPDNCPEYSWYLSEINNFNAHNPFNITITPVTNNTSFPCGCIKNYIEYLKAWSAGATEGVLRWTSCDNPSASVPVSITDFSGSYNCEMSFCEDCRLYFKDFNTGVKTWTQYPITNYLRNMIQSYNAQVGGLNPQPSWYQTIIFNQDSIGETDCKCAIKYATYLNMWVNKNNSEDPNWELPSFAPMSYQQFKKAGCASTDCWRKYKIYKNAVVAAGGSFAPYDPNIDCTCWLSFKDHGDLSNATEGSLRDFCAGVKSYPSNNFYDGINFTAPLEIRRKSGSTQSFSQRFNYCPGPDLMVAEYTNPCSDWLDEVAYRNAEIRYQQQIELLTREFNDKYYQKCMGALETFTVNYGSRDFHFTLYYYDQAGNMVRTVPPAGVKLVTGQANFDLINKDRTFNTKKFYTEHTLSSVYEYNSLNQLTRQSVPDHDKMNRWYVSNTAGIPSNFEATDVQFTSGNEGIMVGKVNDLAQFYKTNDGGKTWTRISDIQTSDITKIAMADANVGYAIGKGGLILKTTDAGLNWKIILTQNTITSQLNDLVVRSNAGTYQGIVGGQDGFFKRFDDNGTALTWYNINLPSGMSSYHVSSISFKDLTAGIGYAIVNNSSNSELISTNSWTTATWTDADIQTKSRANKLTSTYMVNANLGFACGEDGTVMQTTNGGSNWTLLATGIANNLQKIFFKDASSGIVLDGNGKIFKTTNGGFTWVQASAIGTYRDFYFYDRSTLAKGYAVGDNGILAKIEFTTSGFLINKLSLPQTITTNLKSIWMMANGNDGVAVGEAGKIYKITQAGTNLLWYSLVNMGSQNFVKSYMANATTVAAITDNGQFWRANIGALDPNIKQYAATLVQLGLSGNYKDLAQSATFTDLYLLNATVSAVEVHKIASSLIPSAPILPYTSIVKSTGDGDVNNICLTGSAAPSGGANLVISGDLGTIYLAGGSNSNVSKNLTVNQVAKVKSIAGTNNLWLIGADGVVMRSIDNGTNFNLINTATANRFNALDFDNANNGMLAGDLGTVRKWNGTALTAANLSSKENILDATATATDNYWFATANSSIPIIGTSDLGTSYLIYGTSDMYKGYKLPTTVVKLSTGKIAFGGTKGLSGTLQTGAIFSAGYVQPPAVQDVHITKGVGMAVGTSGITLHTSNYGNTWTYSGQLSGYTSRNFNAVWVKAANEAYIAGTNSSIIKLKTDATSQTPLSFNIMPTGNLKGMAFNDEDYGILVGDGQIYRLQPSSTNWIQVRSVSGVTFNSVTLENNFATAVGNGARLEICSDFMNTATFSQKTGMPGGTPDYMKVVSYDRTRAYILAKNGVLVKTVDFWTTFDKKYSDLSNTNTSSNLFALALNTRDELVFAGAAGHVRKVNDQADFASAMYFYDRLGRMVVSQNTRQFNKATPAYSYSLYDVLGRINEVGEKASSTPIEATIVDKQIDDATLAAWMAAGGNSSRTEVTATYYDDQFSGLSTTVLTQNNMRKRVASISYEDVFDGNPATYSHASHFTYDVHGNVTHLVQDIPALAAVGQQYKHIKYNFDLISGKVNLVEYSPGELDQYFHRYTYDADNRIVLVETSHDNVLWDKDATYDYYQHGPLARTEIGDLKVQGLDYFYTIQGWLKGVNSNTLDENRDPGEDGKFGTNHAAVAKDAYGFNLGYFVGDYHDIGNVALPQHALSDMSINNSDLLNARYDLWNGNISSMITCLPNAQDYNATKNINAEAFGNAYKYDQLNRLASSRTFTNLDYADNSWQTGVGTNPQEYATDYAYDAMGNILTQKRNGGGISPQSLDNLTYKYQTQNGNLVSNRLYTVNDNVSSTSYIDDIDDQGTFNNAVSTINTSNNYGYDEMGNLIRDNQEEIANIEWTVYGKIKKVTRSNGSTKANLEFGYDALGSRLWKKVIPAGGNAADIKIYYYLRDAQGNEMSRYVQYTHNSNGLTYESREHSIYGGSRLGIDNTVQILYTSGTANTTLPATYERPLGMKSYELSNHLGNVLVTVTDKKVYKWSGSAVYFEAEITSITDYYPFGSVISARSYSSRAYRFGFDGKEKDNENFEGAYAFEARIFDSRLGRFMSLDPRMSEYAWQTPYAYYKNCPVAIIDYMGKGATDPPDGCTAQGCEPAATTTCAPAPATTGSVGAPQNSNPGWHIPMALPAVETVTAAASNTQSNSTQGTAPAPANNTSSTTNVNQNGQPENPNWLYAADYYGPLPNGAKRITQNNTISEDANSFPWYIVFITNPLMGKGSGMTIPPFTIYLGPTTGMTSEEIEQLKMHEFGHILQYQQICLFNLELWLTTYGIASLKSAATDPKNHYKFWTEVSANLLAYKYFGSPANWDFKNFPIN